MKINKKLISYNFNKGGNSKQYIVVHDTGNASKGATAESHYKYFNGGDRGASAHYFVDDTQVIQCVEDNDRAWHAGKKYGTASRAEVGNANSIGVEICVNSDGDYQKAYNNAVELVTYLMKKYNIPVNNVVTHYEACAKTCPASMSANNWKKWNEFKAKITADKNSLDVIIDDSLTTITAQNTNGYFEATLSELAKLFPEQRFKLRDILGCAGYPTIVYDGGSKTVIATKKTT